MTPRQLHELRKRQIEKMQREELLVGIIASTTANFGACRPKNPINPEDFMLNPFKAEPAAVADTPGERFLSLIESMPAGMFIKGEQ